MKQQQMKISIEIKGAIRIEEQRAYISFHFTRRMGSACTNAKKRTLPKRGMNNTLPTIKRPLFN